MSGITIQTKQVSPEVFEVTVEGAEALILQLDKKVERIVSSALPATSSPPADSSSSHLKKRTYTVTNFKAVADIEKEISQLEGFDLTGDDQDAGGVELTQLKEVWSGLNAFLCGTKLSSGTPLVRAGELRAIFNKAHFLDPAFKDLLPLGIKVVTEDEVIKGLSTLLEACFSQLKWKKLLLSSVTADEVGNMYERVGQYAKDKFFVNRRIKDLLNSLQALKKLREAEDVELRASRSSLSLQQAEASLAIKRCRSISDSVLRGLPGVGYSKHPLEEEYEAFEFVYYVDEKVVLKKAASSLALCAEESQIAKVCSKDYEVGVVGLELAYPSGEFRILSKDFEKRLVDKLKLAGWSVEKEGVDPESMRVSQKGKVLDVRLFSSSSLVVTKKSEPSSSFLIGLDTNCKCRVSLPESVTRALAVDNLSLERFVTLLERTEKKEIPLGDISRATVNQREFLMAYNAAVKAITEDYKSESTR